MIEKHYLESLAKARFQKGTWQLDQSGLMLAQTRERMLNFLDTLNRRLSEALDVYNAAAEKRREIHLIVAQPPSHDVPVSLLLLGRSQLKVLQRGDCLEVSKISIDGYVREEKPVALFKAEVSPLGSFLWTTKEGQSFSEETLIRFLLETLVKVHTEADDF